MGAGTKAVAVETIKKTNAAFMLRPGCCCAGSSDNAVTTLC